MSILQADEVADSDSCDGILARRISELWGLHMAYMDCGGLPPMEQDWKQHIIWTFQTFGGIGLWHDPVSPHISQRTVGFCAQGTVCILRHCWVEFSDCVLSGMHMTAVVTVKARSNIQECNFLVNHLVLGDSFFQSQSHQNKECIVRFKSGVSLAVTCLTVDFAWVFRHLHEIARQQCRVKCIILKSS